MTHEAKAKDLAGSAFPMDEIKRYLEKSIPAQKVVMIVDSCRSGGINLMGTGNKKADNLLVKYLDKLSEARKGFVSISAGGVSQSSIEGPQYGGGHGIFTYYLLKGLKESAATTDENQDQIVDVAEAYEYVRRQVKNETDSRQIPDKTGDLMIGIPLAAVSDRDQPIQILMAMFKEDKDGKPIKVNPGDVLHSDDGYFFILQADKECFLYLFQVDAGGGVYRLFPNAEYNTGQNPVQKRKKFIIPNPKEVLFLDQTVGKEEIYLIASNSRLSNLESLKSGRFGDLNKNLEGVSLKLMGPSGIRPRKARITDDSQDFIVIINELKAKGNFVFKFDFDHRNDK